MIVRVWKGVAHQSAENKYVQHLYNDTLPKLKELKGFQDMEILKRLTDNGIEFMIRTTWDSKENIEMFAGSDIDNAIVPQKVQEMMVVFNDYVEHYTVVSK